MNKLNMNVSTLLIAASSVFSLGFAINSYGDTVKCEDIKHTDDNKMKWGSTDHDDNSPSESKFNKMVEGKNTICEVAKCYDHDECKGEITKGEWKDFKESIVYVGTSKEVNDCLDHRMDLGGELKDYELHHCAVGSY